MICRRMRWVTLGLIGWVSSLFAQPRGPLEAYFFPYRNFTKAQIYQYINLDDPNDILYQLCSTYVDQKDTLFLIKRFNDRFQEMETLIHVISDSGVYLRDYELYIAGRQVQTRVHHAQVYRWRSSKKIAIKWSARFRSVYGEESFRKKRRLVRRNWQYTYATKRHKAICLQDDFRHSVKNNYGAQTTDFQQFTTYARGLGLVAYDRTLASGDHLRFRLDKILNLNQWKARRRHPPHADVPVKRT